MIEVGDVVVFGSGKVHWEVRAVVLAAFDPEYYVLVSGLTGRTIAGHFQGLTIHTKRPAP